MARLQNLVQRAFSAGELAPALGARADLARYLTGARTCRNFIVRPEGGADSRPGTGFVAGAKLDADSAAFLYPFVFAASSTAFIIEAGDLYFRFHRNGAPVRVSGVALWSNVTAYVTGDLVVDAGVTYYCTAANTGQAPPNAAYWYPLEGDIYEIPTPFSAGLFQDPARACFSQQGVVLTITHLNIAPYELVYGGDTRWTLRQVTTAAAIAAPANVAATLGTPGPGPLIYAYLVTAVTRDGSKSKESLPSAVATLTGTLQEPTPEAPNVVTWDPVPAADEYRVYCDPYQNGTFGFIGTATGVEAFYDVGFQADFAVTPPVGRVLFDSPNNYPAVSVVYQQRRVFAGSHNNRELVDASRVGEPNNFGIHSPLQDDDAVRWTLASAQMQPVVHLVPLKQLVVLTDAGEWVVRGGDDGVITPTAINLDQHGYVGANFVRPVVIGNSIIFGQQLGNILRELRFNQDVDGLSGRDLTIASSHLFRTYCVERMAYAYSPDSILWCVRCDGTLLGMTFNRDEEIIAWHRHDTVDGFFEDVCVIPEDGAHQVYVVVLRQVGGTMHRFVERLTQRDVVDSGDLVYATCVDSAVTYIGDPVTDIVGLEHLEGASVMALADGVIRGPFTVSGGSVTLPAAASVAHVGLAITAELETLDLDVSGTGVRDKRKRIQSLTVVVQASARGFFVGPDAEHLIRQRPEAWEDAARLTDGNLEINLTAAFRPEGRTLLRHTDPTPLTVLGFIPQFEVGG
jgi:hypothetical protein